MTRRVLPDLRNARAGIDTKRIARADAITKPVGLRLVNVAADPTTTELWIYDEIGLWWGISSQDIADALATVSTPNVRVRINSPGGDVFEGIAIMNLLASWNGTVTGVVDALCASIATVIAMACESITMSPGSQMMIHPASGGCFGDEADMLQMGALLGFQTNNIAGLYAARAGGDQAAWLSLMAAETWMTADEAVTAGLADSTGVVKQSGVSAVPVSEPEWADMWDLSVFKFAGRSQAPTAHFSPSDEGTDPAASALRNYVRCACHPAGVESADGLLALAHTGECPLAITDARKLPAIEPLTVKWDFVTHPADSTTGTCDECEGLAADGPYLIDDFPGLPVHPNCECSMEPASVSYGDRAPLDPFTAHFLTASPAALAEVDEAELARPWREAFV